MYRNISVFGGGVKREVIKVSTTGAIVPPETLSLFLGVNNVSKIKRLFRKQLHGNWIKNHAAEMANAFNRNIFKFTISRFRTRVEV